VELDVGGAGILIGVPEAAGFEEGRGNGPIAQGKVADCRQGVSFKSKNQSVTTLAAAPSWLGCLTIYFGGTLVFVLTYIGLVFLIYRVFALP
jgi:hypothetical protein